MDKAQPPDIISAGPPGVPPPPPPPPPSGRQRDEDRLTRKPLSVWDRIKFLLLLGLIWFLLVWSVMANDPLVGFSDAVRIEVRTGWWVFALIGLEVLRQVHFLISEHSAGYHHFWTETVFGGFERVTHRRISDWSRFRIWRAMTWIFWIVILAVVAGKILHTTPLLALLRAPQIIWHALPFVLQIVVTLLFVVLQFVALFWFMSRGGVDVYYPDDIKTRFSDVWGQDHVLERVKENIIFLENPELVEERGGYVPGGLLLWGPPGTGKTLMAEAVAGETGRPYVFVDPGAFINMFMGVGILKVKGLFRKLRRLALRYGGVIVFFDEADSLGNRGQITQGGVGAPVGATPAPFATAGCHGFSYLSEDTRWMLTRDAMGSEIGDADEKGTRRNRQMIGGMMNGGNGGGMGTLQALLTELSGLKKPRGFVNRYVRRVFGMRPKPPPKYRMLVMMATNMPSALDEALLRPGRIDRIYKVGYPSKAGRIRTYQGYLDKVQHELTEVSGLKKPRGFVNRYVRRIFGMRPKPPPKYRILVMMATNLPSALDEALLRPGRIDRIYKVGYPSKAGRIRTYEGYLNKVQHELTEEQIDKLATITPYATGATIKDLVNEALITAIRNGRDVITWPDVIKAKQLKELGPPEDVEYIERERHAVAVHEACHALVAFRTRQHMEIDIATIEKGSDYLGMVASIPPEDQFTHWRSEYEADILVSLASLAGERMFFDQDSSSGVSGDLESATAVASFMEGFWGMGTTVSSYSMAKRLDVGAPGGGRGGTLKKGQDPEAQVRRALADRIEDKLTTLLSRVEEILKEDRNHVLALAHALETHKTLSGEDVIAVMEHTQGPLVDGRPYADEHFLNSLSDYHLAVARAHREHSQEQLNMPAPTPEPAAVSPWAIMTDDLPGLNGHNPEPS